MRLIRASSINNNPPNIELVDFNPDQLPRYAILSHTWGDDEVVYADIRNQNAATKSTFSKVRYSCIQTLADDLEYVWIDSCCIDKSSSAELSEAINSMYEWYMKSEICYTYLSGVPSTVDPVKTDGVFASCRWFTRGWTLQELLAPAEMVFYSEDWVKVGVKTALSRPLSVITGIDEDILTGLKPLESASLAKRMSWAAHRQTTRPEDVAYCLMGLFGVNMPMLYGEGDRAFLRLQEEIMKQSDDQSLFAWVDLSASTETYHGLLAKSPSNFAYSNTIMPYQDWEPRPPYFMSNRGLRIDLPLTLRGEDIFVAALDCPAPPDYEDSTFLAIYLKKISSGGDQQFARVRVNQFAKVQERGNRQTLYVRQTFNGVVDAEGVFPQHIIQLRKGPPRDQYSVLSIVKSKEHDRDRPMACTSSRGTGRDLIHTTTGKTIAFRNPKAAGQLAGAVTFARLDGSRLLVMFGSTDGIRAGFHARELPPRFPGMNQTARNQEPPEAPLEFDDLQSIFRPSRAGVDVELERFRVRVDVETVIANASKYLMADVLIEPVNRPWDPFEPLDAAIGWYEGATGRQNRGEAAQAAQATHGKTKRASGWRRLIS
ncbi:HET domain-containing protein [Colletotrichum orchidophilum]|uniref:HET domain-containing protein n=1 Tax=Colletotrichum orchidophilum TaxID=1209926 RepID=A0A1G4BIR4_9PEZI|nr:HET domain-containing protein [Colletotrichum orchidophilum]OHF01196.1 HET domain-containing protein [Colletotrichum orchidophilum]